tara:strand:- start:1600 stop:3186 length:1587 start_codon:yes stop_codon:yes gene_type:complete
MPIVYSPGEAEVRPLDPTAVVYTTAQRVADLLEIDKPEPVLVSANSDTGAMYILGSDLREHGFEAGDTVFVYSDADPVGETLTINTVASSAGGDSAGVGYVKITFTTSPLTAADYQVADNAYIQNQASFTNRKGRGVTKSKVENLILRAQDIIDNKTHNSWRPYLVAGEYLNFDTYKPYRRRYYTDYVGTAPLLFRNVQQILRLELWQGDDYREIGAAEARIHLPEDVRAISGSIVMSPGNGSAATLTAGTSSAQWRADFDSTTTAQNLADLINKEDRVSKGQVAFSPTFTLEGSSNPVAIHNEFLASANSDYGTGKVKVTSMRPVKAGESCSIVTTDSSITFKETSTHTATVTSVVSTTINVDSTADFATAGVCVKGDTVFRYTGKTATSFTGCVSVTGSPIADITATITQDTFVVDLQGGSSSGDSGRLRDWWYDAEMGIIYFNNSYPFFEWNAIKVAYIYGERYIEKAIEDVCTKMVAIELLMSDDRSVLIPEGTQNVDLTSKIQLWQKDIETILPRYREVVVFE